MFLLFNRQRLPAPLPRPPRGPDHDGADDGFIGCGWFDSSHDLRCGLLLTELPPSERLPSALALQVFLAARLQPGCAMALTVAQASLRPR